MTRYLVGIAFGVGLLLAWERVQLRRDIVKLNDLIIEVDRRREADWCYWEQRLQNTRDLCEAQYQALGQMFVSNEDSIRALSYELSDLRVKRFARRK